MSSLHLDGHSAVKLWNLIIFALIQAFRLFV